MNLLSPQPWVFVRQKLMTLSCHTCQCPWGYLVWYPGEWNVLNMQDLWGKVIRSSASSKLSGKGTHTACKGLVHLGLVLKLCILGLYGFQQRWCWYWGRDDTWKVGFRVHSEVNINWDCVHQMNQNQSSFQVCTCHWHIIWGAPHHQLEINERQDPV